MNEYKPVPVETAKAIAEQFDKSIVIVCCYDPAHGLLHTTTYGSDPQNKAWAAQGGEIAYRALGGLPEAATTFEDCRLTEAKKLLYALKTSIRIFKEHDIDSAEVAMLKRSIKAAERFLGNGR